VSTLPDPTLSLNALSFPTDTFSVSQEAMTQKQIGIGLTLRQGRDAEVLVFDLPGSA
jgi:hypothetical protein